ncbi:hypothetical protein N0V90_001487 [Kalmusia sp. IMI 367209]|nr:hypothetical protein N0V90_001487 [Kalmusia sp. IMI 367209]
MKVSLAATLSAALCLVTSTHAANILMNNDDGFGSGNIRELYRILKENGHDVRIVAPLSDQSGQAGRSSYTTEANLTAPSEYNLIPAGAPSVGPDPYDSHIWYYNGTPAACTFVALDYVLPRYFPGWKPDLMTSGPNFGTNPGPFLYTLAGTLGATYAAVERSIPAIAFSASNKNVGYMNVTNSSNPATWSAAVSAKIVQQFLNATPEDQSVLPLGYGINVNIPELTSDEMPPIVATRLTGEADVDIAVYNETTGLFKYGNLEPKAAGVNVCYNGDCGLPGENYVVEGGSVSISVFTVDYDAPANAYTADVLKKFAPLTEDSGNSTTYGKRALAKRGLVRREERA